MSNTTVLSPRAHLVQVADRLVLEFDDVGAGSVLRCFSRAVFLARRSGVSPESLPRFAEEVAQGMLVRRGASTAPRAEA